MRATVAALFVAALFVAAMSLWCSPPTDTEPSLPLVTREGEVVLTADDMADIDGDK